MEITLVINPGSSSKKFALYKDDVLLLNAHVERSDDGFEMCTTIGNTQQKCEFLDKKGFKESLLNFLDLAKESEHISIFTDISCVAIRVVAPGTFFQEHRIIDAQYIEKLLAVSLIAPLHIPHTFHEIEAVKQFLPHTKIVAVSDSAFHSTIPNYIRRYSIPEKDSKDFDIYHFGYHGISVASVLRKVKKLVKHDVSKAVVCHIGSGVSITAIENGNSVETTMGYDPGSGLIMGSRAGDLPTGALITLMQRQNLKPSDALVYIQTNGGLKALAGEADLRLLLERRSKGELEATEALSSFIHHIQKSIGAYVAILGGIDTLIFTATASERSSVLRALITEKLGGLNIYIDENKNDTCVSRDGFLSNSDSPVSVLVIKTNEADEMLHISKTL